MPPGRAGGDLERPRRSHRDRLRSPRPRAYPLPVVTEPVAGHFPTGQIEIEALFEGKLSAEIEFRIQSR